MRPRQSSLGIPRGSTLSKRDRGCFNEAEAIKPRNHAPYSSSRLGDMRFNEAEAIKPRNLGRRCMFWISCSKLQ